MQLSNSLFTDQLKVYQLDKDEALTIGNFTIDSQLFARSAPGDHVLSVNKIATYLKDKSTETVYSFFCKTDAEVGNWRLCCCRLGESKDMQKKELIVFTYDLDLLDEIKKRLFAVLEQDVFFKENFHKAANLTKKEKEITLLLAKGMNSRKIADFSFTSVNTVNTHRQHIKKKLGIKNLAALQQFAEVFDFASEN
ncbi:DNA-binding CsgD family transcriptional regulator [Pedobacter sp. UYEF25]